VPFVLILAILAGLGYAAFSRLLAHRERMAELESKRPHVMLQLPPGDLVNADRLTDDIIEACREKGIEVDLEIR
jgi:BarA-like signal transduction histidine kinase